MFVPGTTDQLPRIRTRLNGRRVLHSLERLEIRSLLSASVQVIGLEHVIGFNDNSPSIFDGTDFRRMSTTVDATVGTAFRRYTIKNVGDADLTGTGPVEVVVSGTNAADFIVEAQPDGTVAAGDTTAFNLQFIPHGTGTRTAKVTINTNDPIHPAFTFTVKGVGVTTANDSSNHLQVVTTHGGTGAGALSQNGTINGTTIMVDYTGYLLGGGVVFDSSVYESATTRGHSPLQVTVGAGGVIAGFDQGLKGIKAGESRTLFIPAAIGYGDSGNGSIPGGATLVFVVTRRKTPTLGVFGNDQIGFGEAAPSPDDGTYLGTIPAGSTTHQLTGTFQLYQVNPGTPFIGLTTSTPLRVTGPQKSDFTIQPQLNSSGQFTGIFSVIYAPSKPRTSSAVVHIRSTDPDHPDFVFMIGAAETPFNDLAVSLGHINYPASGTITSGAASKFTFPAVVKNNGNIPVPNTPVDVMLQIHNLTSGQYTVLSNFTTTFFQGLPVGGTRTMNVTVPVPIDVSSGTYDVLMSVDSIDSLHEGNHDNNVGSTSQHITIVQGVNGLTGNLVSLNPVTPIIAASSPFAATLQVSLMNTGNLTLLSSQQVTIQAVAIDTTTQAQTLLGPAGKMSLTGWAPNHSGSFNATIKLLAGLAAGTYNLSVIVTPTPALAGVPNFTLTTDAGNNPIVLSVT